MLRLLTERGHEVTHAFSFQQAAELLTHSAPDCLCLRLNHATAPEVAELLGTARQTGGGTYIIAITDAAESTSRVEAWLKRGFDDFFIDPSVGGEASFATRLAIAESTLQKRREAERRTDDDSRQQRRFEELFAHSPSATLVVNARDGLIMEVNPAAEHLLGLPRAELAEHYLSLVLPELFDREDYDPRRAGLHEPLRLEEVRYQRGESAQRWLGVSVARVPWAPGQALLLEFTDTTAQRERAGRRIQEARMDAASRVMGGTARELSDSLTSLQGNIDLLQRQPLPRQEIRDLLTATGEAAARAGALAQRLATLARAPMGGDLRRRPADLKSIVERSAGFALLHGRSRPAFQLPEDLWAVELDEDAFAAAIAAIAKNASESMPQGGTVQIHAENFQDTAATPPCVRLRIRDHGQGIASEHLTRVFDPWFTTKGGREGMGLPIASATIRAHGGHISIESELGHGTIVTIWLPVPQPISASSGEPPLPPSLARPPLRRQRILFMDDDASIRSVVYKLLTSHGYDTHCTVDGEEAIEAYRRAKEFAAPFDLVLVDLDVRGGMGGQEAVALLHREFPTVKALLTTGFIDDALMVSFREHGFLGVIPKPFQLDLLTRSIGRLLGVKE